MRPRQRKGLMSYVGSSNTNEMCRLTTEPGFCSKVLWENLFEMYPFLAYAGEACSIISDAILVFYTMCPPSVMQQQLLTVKMSNNNVFNVIDNIIDYNDENKYSMVSQPVSFIFFNIENDLHSTKKNLTISLPTNQLVSHSGSSHHGL